MTATNSDSPQPSLRERLIQFQKDTLAEWDNPHGKNVDMIKLAYRFEAELLRLLASTKLEKKTLDESHGTYSDEYHKEISGYNRGAAAQYAAILTALGVKE